MTFKKIKLFLKSARKARLLPPLDSCQVLAVDNGIEYLKECFPEHTSYLHLPIRGEVFYLNWSIFINLSKFLISKSSNGFGLRGCYVAAIAKHLRPKVIVTMIDNNNWDTNLSMILDIPVICIANCILLPSHLHKKHFDYYFALNTAPIDNSLTYNCSINEFHATGHIKIGLYLEKFWDNDFAPSSDNATLLWISQFREFVYFSTESHYVQQKRAELMGIEFMSKYTSSHNFAARVAITSERKNLDKNIETTLFQRAGNNNLQLSEGFPDEWVSYHEVKNATLVIGMSSTLLIESLSVGKRVVFVLPDDCPDMRSHVGQAIRLDLIAPLVFSENDYKSFENHCDKILNMPDDEYSRLIEPIQNDVAPLDKAYLPHHQIRDKISALVSEQ